MMRKKSDDIERSALPEVDMSSDDWEDLERGVILFNQGRFQHAQDVWTRIVERHDESGVPFIEGMSHLAAAYHSLLTMRDHDLSVERLTRAVETLSLFQPQYMGVYVEPILRLTEKAGGEILRAGKQRLDQFNPRLVPKIHFTKPRDANSTDEIRRALSTDRFREGVRLFNQGYFWEAHEVWEEVWHAEEGDTKVLVQAFVQMAAAYSFLQRSRLASAAYLFEKATQKFQKFVESNVEVEIDRYIDTLQSALEQIQELSMPRKQAERKPIPVPRISTLSSANSPAD